MNYSSSKHLKWSLVGFILVATIFLWLIAGSSLVGYCLVSVQGTSMEPALQHGDALWSKHLGPAELKAGDIVSLQHPIQGLITHRLIDVQPLPQEGYLLETRGDANSCPERWEVGADETIIVSLSRVHYAGYVFEFLGSIGGIVLIIGLAALAITIYVRRGRAGP